MIKYKLIVFLFSILLFSFIVPIRENEDYESIANRLRDKISEEIQQKYHVKQLGTRGGMYQCVRLLGLVFTYNKPILHDEARALIVPMLQLFQQRINENEEIRPYLQKYPFPLENIEIGIVINGENDEDIYDPYIHIASFNNRFFNFSTFTPDKPYDPKNKFRESFEEAVEKLKKQTES